MAASFPPYVYTIGDLTVDVGSRRVTRGQDELKLGKLTFDLLVTLADRAPFLVDHDEIADRVWPGRAVSSEVIAQRVKMLRKSLGDSAEEPRYIRVARGQGYQLIPPVHVSTTTQQTAEPSGGTPRRFDFPIAIAAANSAVLPSRRRNFLYIGALAVGGIFASWAAWVFYPEPPLEPGPITRFFHPISEEPEASLPLYNPVTISPDGRRIAYTTTGGLYLRELGELEARLLNGTDYDRLRGPFFFPDGKSIAYTVQGDLLERVGIDGGEPIVINDDYPGNFGSSWAPDNTDIFSAGRDGIYRVSATDGSSELLIESQEGEIFGTPHLLPDGDTLLFAVAKDPQVPIFLSDLNWNDAQIVAQSLQTGHRTKLIDGGSHPRYVSTGHLIYSSGNTLYGVAFDSGTVTISGRAVPVVHDVQRAPDIAPFAYYDISDDGTLVYVRDGYLNTDTVPVWIDRYGRPETINAPPSSYSSGQLSPDGTRIVFQSGDGSVHVSVFNLERETSHRLTLSREPEMTPIWVDNARLAFRRPGPTPTALRPDLTANIFVRASDGSGVETQLTRVSQGAAIPTDIFPDGATMLYSRIAPMNAGIWAVSMDGTATAGQPVLDSAVQEWNALISPDGTWLAYQSDESGQFEVYVRPFPDVDARRVLVSQGGGSHPIWSRDGSELFYLSLSQSDSGMQGEIFSRLRTGALMAVPIDTELDFAGDDPKKLFENVFVVPGWEHHAYDVAADGRFLMFQRNSQDARGIVIVENWIEDLQRLVPTE